MEKPWTYGVFGGPTLANAAFVLGSSAQSRSARTGLHVGGYAEFPLTSWLKLRPELAIFQKGSKDSGGTTELDYLDIPALFVARTVIGGSTVFFPFGPAFSVLLRRHRVTTDGGIYQVDGSAVANNELSFVAGVGIGLNIFESVGTSVMLRYSHGLTNISKFSSNNLPTSYQSRVISLLLGIDLDIFTDDPDGEEARAKKFLEERK